MSEATDVSRLERLLERLVTLAEHSGDQIYLVCAALDKPGLDIYGPKCEPANRVVVP